MAYIPLVLVVAIVAWFVAAYNKLVRFRNQIRNAWHQIDVQLKHAHDLIPNLVETAKGYMKHERETLRTVIQGAERGGRRRGRPLEGARGRRRGGRRAHRTLKSLFAVVEKLPGAEGEPERRRAAGGADRDGEQDLLRPTVLQRLGDDVQQRDPVDPDQLHRLLLQLLPGSVLRNGTRKPGGAEGEPAVTRSGARRDQRHRSRVSEVRRRQSSRAGPLLPLRGIARGGSRRERLRRQRLAPAGSRPPLKPIPMLLFTEAARHNVRMSVLLFALLFVVFFLLGTAIGAPPGTP